MPTKATDERRAHRLLRRSAPLSSRPAPKLPLLPVCSMARQPQTWRNKGRRLMKLHSKRPCLQRLSRSKVPMQHRHYRSKNCSKPPQVHAFGP